MRAAFLRIGPSGADGRPTIQLEMDGGYVVVVPLDRAHGRSIANRILDCVHGTSCRTLELELAPVTSGVVGQA